MNQNPCDISASVSLATPHSGGMVPRFPSNFSTFEVGRIIPYQG